MAVLRARGCKLYAILRKYFRFASAIDPVYILPVQHGSYTPFSSRYLSVRLITVIIVVIMTVTAITTTRNKASHPRVGLCNIGNLSESS